MALVIQPPTANAAIVAEQRTIQSLWFSWVLMAVLVDRLKQFGDTRHIGGDPGTEFETVVDASSPTFSGGRKADDDEE